MIRVALVLLVGCGAGAQLHEPPPASTPWCFAAVGTFDDAHNVGHICTVTRRACLYVREHAAAIAGLAQITEVGDCRWEEN